MVRDLRHYKDYMDQQPVNWEFLRIILAIIIFFVIAYFISQNSSIIVYLTSGYGLFGLFVAAIIANATVFFPLLIEPIVFLIASSQQSLVGALFVGIVMGSGAAIGEMTSYLLGLLGIEAIKKKGIFELEKIAFIREKIEDKGMVFIYLVSIIPFPFDIIGITAGLIKYDFRKFFVAALFGKSTRYMLIALAGFYGLSAIKGFFHI